MRRLHAHAMVVLLSAAGWTSAAEPVPPLVPAGAVWRYVADGLAPDPGWREPGFTDSAWTPARVELSYVEEDETTLFDIDPEHAGPPPTMYFRHTFTAADPRAYDRLYLDLVCADGCLVHLNGVEVDRRNLASLPDPATLVPRPASADGGTEPTYRVALAPSLLLPGQNVLTVDYLRAPMDGRRRGFDARLSTLLATMRKGPYLMLTGVPSEMMVLWQLSLTQSCTLAWGRDTTYSDGSVVSTEFGLDHQHQRVLTGLLPATRYYYRMTDGDGAQHTGSFLSAPLANAAAVKMLGHGDCRTNPLEHEKIANLMVAAYQADPEFQTLDLLSGDWASSDSEFAWDNEFFIPTAPRLAELIATVPTEGSRGNHEGAGAVYAKYWPYPYASPFYFSLDYGPVHVVMVDQYVAYDSASPQYAWLDNDLATTTKPWKIMVFHEPAWSAAGGHANNLAAQTYLHPLARSHGVDMMFTGHNHYYARAVVDNVQHVTSGGGGAPLYVPDPAQPFLVTTSQTLDYVTMTFQCDQFDLHAYNDSGQQIDAFTVIKPTGLVPGPPANLTATPASPTAIDLSWTAGSGNETAFEIERSSDGTAWSPLATVPPTPTTYQDTGLSPATTYWYRLSAVNAPCRSTASLEVFAVTCTNLADVADSLRMVKALPTMIRTYWASVSGATAYHLYEDTAKSGSFTTLAMTGSDGSAGETFMPNSGPVYFYKVAAANVCGDGPK